MKTKLDAFIAGASIMFLFIFCMTVKEEIRKNKWRKRSYVIK